MCVCSCIQHVSGTRRADKTVKQLLPVLFFFFQGRALSAGGYGHGSFHRRMRRYGRMVRWCKDLTGAEGTVATPAV